jgi:hypothetical protein
MISNETFIGADYIKDLSICDELIESFKNSKATYPGTAGNTFDEEIKKSKDLNFKFVEESLRTRYFTLLQEIMEEYKKTFKYCDESCAYWGLVEQPNIQKYNPSDAFYAWHAERSGSEVPMAYRHLVYMTYLNDVTDEGETEFFYQKVKVQPRKGLTLIWPADWTHTHRGITSPTQTKYIVTGWYSFIPKDT